MTGIDLMKKASLMAALSILVLASASVAGRAHARFESQPEARYPHELSGYEFYQRAGWRSLTPLVATMADVRRVLGEPKVARDISHFTEPYPGDALANSPVFTYDFGSADWELFVYFVKYSSCECPRLRQSHGDRLFSVEILPKKSLSFENIVFPAVFKKREVIAADAVWDEYADGSGLSYEVYTKSTLRGSRKAGDLNRIVYAPSAEEIAKAEGE